MHSSAPILANFRDYDEKKIQEKIAIDKYIEKLESEVFFTSNGAFV
jgi:hypothetical protein